MLKVGINWLSPYTLPTVQRLLDEGVADFCEIMVDNAVHFPPEKILAALSGVPLALHIVNSNFLTKSIAELAEMERHLRPWMEALQPFYISDHLPQLDYQRDFAKTAERVSEWQKLLGATLLLENAASMGAEGVGQAAFYARLIKETQCGLLFDFSNAYIAEHNIRVSSHAGHPVPEAAPDPVSLAIVGHPVQLLARDPVSLAISHWSPLIKHAQHFHVAGFYIEPKTHLAYDTHDAPVSDEVMKMLCAHFERIAKPSTIVFELDAKLDYELAKEQILAVKAAFDERADNALRNVPPCTRRLSPSMAATSFAALSARTSSAARHPVDDTWQFLRDFVTEWSLRGLDHIDAKGIIVRSKDLPNMAVGLWKGVEPHQPAKIVTLDISALNLPPADAYAISYKTGSWASVEWSDVIDFQCI